MTEATWLIDTMRVATVVMAGALIVYTGAVVSHWRTLPYDLGRKLRYLALLGYGVTTAMDQWQQVGQPVVLWRCVLLFFVTLFALLGMALPEVGSWRWGLESPADKFKRPDA